MRETLEHLQRRFAILRHTIDERATGKFLVESPHEELLFSTMARSCENHWLEVAEQQLHEPFAFIS